MSTVRPGAIRVISSVFFMLFRHYLIACLGLFFVFAACGGPETETNGIGRACSHDRNCEQGQACVVTALTPEGEELTTCQIPCRSSNDCPNKYLCQSGSTEVPASICVKE